MGHFLRIFVLCLLPGWVWASSPNPNIRRFTENSLRQEVEQTLLGGDPSDLEAYTVTIRAFSHPLRRYLPSPLLERLLHQVDGRVIDFYELSFDISDQLNRQIQLQVTCEVTDFQSDHYLVIENCAVSRNEGARSPTGISKLRRGFYWMVMYEELRFQRR